MNTAAVAARSRPTRRFSHIVMAGIVMVQLVVVYG
jgi:hypothetical protein